MKVDITLEFYHKTAVYKSPITGGHTPINIKDVFFETGNQYPLNGKIWTTITVISTHGISYDISDLIFKITDQLIR